MNRIVTFQMDNSQVDPGRPGVLQCPRIEASGSGGNEREETPMTTATTSYASRRLSRLMRGAAESHIPVLISGRGVASVLVSSEDWRAIQETLDLLAVPGMRESVREGLGTPVEDCATALEW